MGVYHESSYPHADRAGLRRVLRWPENRDYDDGDFDQPKRSSPYQDMDGDEYDDDYADDYEDEDEYAASSVKKGARKGGGSAGGTVKILGGVIVLLVVILIALVVVRAVITNKRNTNGGVKPSESVSTIPEQTTNPAPMVFGPAGSATDEPTVSGDAYTTPDSDWSAGFGETTPNMGGENTNDPVPDDTDTAKRADWISKRQRR